MTFNQQTKFGKQGNCFAACVSSILGLPIEEVPNVETLFEIEEYRTFQDEYPPLWAYVLDSFLRSIGYIWRPATDEEISNPPKDKVFLCIGRSLNGETNHAVLYRNGELYFDPNPYRKGISEILSLQVIERA